MNRHDQDADFPIRLVGEYQWSKLAWLIRAKSDTCPLAASAFAALARLYVAGNVLINSSSYLLLRAQFRLCDKGNIISNKKARSSRMRTKGHSLAVPPHFDGRCSTCALVTLTVISGEVYQVSLVMT